MSNFQGVMFILLLLNYHHISRKVVLAWVKLHFKFEEMHENMKFNTLYACSCVECKLDVKIQFSLHTCYTCHIPIKLTIEPFCHVTSFNTYAY